MATQYTQELLTRIQQYEEGLISKLELINEVNAWAAVKLNELTASLVSAEGIDRKHFN